MTDLQDHGIRLFGQVIQMGSTFDEDTRAEHHIGTDSHTTQHCNDDSHEYDCYSECTSSDQNSKQSRNRGTKEISSEFAKQKDDSSSSSESRDNPSHSSSTENRKTLSSDKGYSSQDLCNKADSREQTSSTSLQDQNSPPKKPDKILPCPRCNSMSTKFCYFNNYNVHQPRYFCRDCQRYWTAGGTMRNVPVGAGRRKSKSSSVSQYRHIMSPEFSDGLMHDARQPNGTVLRFGQHSSVVESTAPMTPFGFVNGTANSNSSFVEKRVSEALHGLQPPQVLSMKGSSRPFPINPMSWQAGFPVAFYSTPPRWACNSAGNWNPQHAQPDLSSSCSSRNSQSPRKHSRDGTLLLFGPSDSDSNDPTEAENARVVMSKAARLDDPIDAANSSIWSTVRNKSNKHVIPLHDKGGFFGGAQQYYGNVHERNNANGEVSSMALQFNPAAFSRSLSFHEIAR